MRLKPPLPILAEDAARLEIGDHRRRSRSLKRRPAVGAVEAHHSGHPGVPCVFAKHPQIGDQVARHDRAVAASGVEGADLLLSLEPVVADHILPIREIELVRLFAAVFVHLGPIIRDQPVERIPQRQIIAVRHGFGSSSLNRRCGLRRLIGPATRSPNPG